jgi:hypothetical protein
VEEDALLLLVDRSRRRTVPPTLVNPSQDRAILTCSGIAASACGGGRIAGIPYARWEERRRG